MPKKTAHSVESGYSTAVLIEELLTDLTTTAIFKEFLRTQNSTEYLSAWAFVGQMLNTDDPIVRMTQFSKFKKSYIIESAEQQIFLDYAVQQQLLGVKLPTDDILETAKAEIVASLEDGYVNMMMDPEWKRRIESGSPPKWARKRSFRKISRKESDEVLIQCVQDSQASNK